MFTKHYLFGLIAGIGIGFFISGMLASSASRDSLRLLVVVGFVLALVGGVLYSLDRRSR